jgi:hypothetical protein
MYLALKFGKTNALSTHGGYRERRFALCFGPAFLRVVLLCTRADLTDRFRDADARRCPIVCLAARPSVFLTVGVDWTTPERPLSSAFAADLSTTPAAASAAAPAASPATVLSLSAPRCAAFTIALRAFVTVLTIVFALQWDNGVTMPDAHASSAPLHQACVIGVAFAAQ